MSLEEIKSEMKNYRDLYGGSIVLTDQIDSAQTKEELRRIIELYRISMEMMQRKASSDLDEFQNKIGLNDFSGRKLLYIVYKTISDNLFVILLSLCVFAFSIIRILEYFNK